MIVLKFFALGVVTPLIALAGFVVTQLPAFGASALLHPSRHTIGRAAPAGCRETTFVGAEVALSGWDCRTSTARAATIIYLHGVADNRGSAEGVVARFRPRGFDVIAYDSRAHGGSGG